MINRQDSLEENIKNMLEQVLKEDSEEEDYINTNFHKRNVKRKDSRSHTINVIDRNKPDKNGVCSDLLYTNFNSKPQTPRIFINNIALSQEEKPKQSNITNFSNTEIGINRSPKLEYSRSWNRNKTVNYNNFLEFPHAPQNNYIIENNINKSNYDNYNSLSTCSSLTLNCTNINDQNKKTIIENPALFSYNEFDEILEGKIRRFEAIDFDSYELLKGNFLRVITSQNGSRILQNSLTNTSNDIISFIYEEIGEKVNELMVDPYANYFCQKFFMKINKSERIKFLTVLKYNFIEIGKSKIGTYPLQAIIDQLKTNEEKMIVIETVIDDIITLCLDPQGCHVAEKIINCFEEELIQQIYETVIDNFMMLATNANGICVIKKLIFHGRDIRSLHKIRKILAENTLELVQNAFGNYVLQVAFENWSIDFCIPISINFKDNFYKLSLQKYSSNVIEKCFEKGDQVLLENFAEEICVQSKIIDLMKNSYGNYVVQKALKLSSGATKFKIATCIKKNLDKLMEKKLINKWKTIVNSSLHLNLGNIESNFNGLNLSGSTNNSINSNRSNNQMHSPNHSPTIFYGNKFIGSPINYNPTLYNNLLPPQFPIPINHNNFQQTPHYIPKTLNY